MTMTTSRAPVVIVGAGITGSALASMLHSTGVAVELLERQPSAVRSAAGIILHPNALAALGHLADPVRQHGSPIVTQVTRFPDSSQTIVRWASVWGESANPLGISRDDLVDVLRTACDGVPTRWGAEVVEVRTTPDGVVCRLADGEQVHGSIVVGADGINSHVRTVVDATARPQFTGQLYMRTLLDAESGNVPPGQWQVWRYPGGSVGCVPISAQQQHVFVELDRPDPAPPRRGTEIDAMRQAFTAAGACLTLPNAARVDCRAAHTLVTAEVTRGRVALIGDAAHALHPSTSQSAALGLEDAAVLAQEIRSCGPTTAALQAYAARRTPRISRFLHAARIHQLLIGCGVTQASEAHGERISTRSADRWYQRLYHDLLEPV